MARHRKDYQGERLTAQVTVQLTAADRAALDEATAQIGQTVSDFARTWVLEGMRATAKARALMVAQVEIDRQLTADLVQHGQVLNELAHRANESQEIGDLPTIRHAVGVLLKVIDRIGGVPKGTVRVSDGRRALMNEVTRVGNNISQLQSVARVRKAVEAVALLHEAQGRIVLCCERMIST